MYLKPSLKQILSVRMRSTEKAPTGLQLSTCQFYLKCHASLRYSADWEKDKEEGQRKSLWWSEMSFCRFVVLLLSYLVLLNKGIWPGLLLGRSSKPGAAVSIIIVWCFRPQQLLTNLKDLNKSWPKIRHLITHKAVTVIYCNTHSSHPALHRTCWHSVPKRAQPRINACWSSCGCCSLLNHRDSCHLPSSKLLGRGAQKANRKHPGELLSFLLCLTLFFRAINEASGSAQTEIPPSQHPAAASPHPQHSSLLPDIPKAQQSTEQVVNSLLSEVSSEYLSIWIPPPHHILPEDE